MHLLFLLVSSFTFLFGTHSYNFQPTTNCTDEEISRTSNITGPDVLLWHDNITTWRSSASVNIELIYEAMPTIQNVNYPRLTREDIAQGLRPHGYRGDLTRSQHALRRARSEGKLNIAILGGSVTKGMNAGEKGCGRWSNHLDHILQRVLFPQMKITINNMAIPATPSDVQAKSHFSVLMPGIKAAHIVLVDLTANDGPTDNVHCPEQEGRLLMELLLQHSSPRTAIVYLETFNRYWLSSPTVVLPTQMNQCSGNRTLEPKIENYKIPPPMHTQCDRSKIDVAMNFHWCNLLELQIPIISYVDISCRYSHFPWRKKINSIFLWGPSLHPSIKVHMLIAQVVGLSIFELYRETIDGQNYNYPSNAMSAEVKQWAGYIRAHALQVGELSDKGQESHCSADPTTRLPDEEGQPFEPLSAGAEWFHGEDVKGKPGWIAQSIQAGNDTHIDTRREIRFGLNVSPYNGRGIVKLELLSSYAHMGALSCCVNCDGAAFTPTVTIDTNTKEHMSQTFVASVPFFNGHDGKSVSNNSYCILRCRANAGKVKIVTVIGC